MESVFNHGSAGSALAPRVSASIEMFEPESTPRSPKLLWAGEGKKLICSRIGPAPPPAP